MAFIQARKNLMNMIVLLFSLTLVSTRAINVNYASREVDLGHTDLLMVRTLYTFNPESETKFKFAIARDFEENLLKVTAQTDLKEKDADKFIKRSDSNEHYGAIVYEYDFARLKKQLMAEAANGKFIKIQINEYYKRRTSPYPEEMKMMQKHVFKIQDSALIFSPYAIAEEFTSVLGERRNFKGFT